MATTANYGWSTPDDTSLVKDGASAIRTLGSSIDTTVFNNANAAIAKSIVDAKGDLIAATAADTVSRLASSGVNGDVLTVDTSTSTGLKWSAPATGGMTSIATGTLSGNSVSITSIPTIYNRLYIELYAPTTDTGGRSLFITFNSDTGTNYQVRKVTGTATTLSYEDRANILLPTTPTTSDSYALNGWIFNYKDTASQKLIQLNQGSTVAGLSQFWTKYESNTAITSIQFTTEATFNFTGGTYTIWGEK